jgi:hypothetical protein
MRIRLPLILALALLGIAAVATGSDAAESRVGIFSIPCDGANKHTDFFATALGAPAATRLIQGGEVSLIGTRGALSYLVVRALGDEKKQIVTLGTGAVDARVDFTGFVPATLDGSGNVLIAVDAACTPGAGALTAIVTVYFF